MLGAKQTLQRSKVVQSGVSILATVRRTTFAVPGFSSSSLAKKEPVSSEMLFGTDSSSICKSSGNKYWPLSSAQ